MVRNAGEALKELEETADKVMMQINKLHKDKFESRLRNYYKIITISLSVFIGSIAVLLITNVLTSIKNDPIADWLIMIYLCVLFLTIASSFITYLYAHLIYHVYPSMNSKIESIKPELDRIFGEDKTNLANDLDEIIKRTIIPETINISRADLISNWSNIFQIAGMFLCCGMLLIILARIIYL